MRRLSATSLPFTTLSTVILSILICSTLSFAAAADRITGPVTASQLVQLSAGVPMKAQPQFDQGPVDPSLKLSYMTLLTVPTASQQKAIDHLLAQQQDRRSALYHQWLTPEQYADRFGLSPNDIQKLTAWLQAQGFSVQSVARARNFIVFSGTAAQTQTAFQTQIHNFNVNGQTNFSNTTPISIPAALSGVVSGVRGLSNFRATSYILHKNPKYSFPVGNNEYDFFIAPGDLATMYDIDPLYSASINGTGQRLAVVGETDVYLADLNDFRSSFGLPAIPTTGTGSCATDANGLITSCQVGTSTTTYPFQYVLVNTDPGAPGSDLDEADLDLEWSNAVAQDAQIIYVNAPDPNGDGVWDSWYYAVANNVAPVITMSYGICELGEAEVASGEGSFTSDEAELKTANLQGITFMNSSGDSGAAGCDNSPPNSTPPYQAAQFGQFVNYPASSPEVTGVGGTAVTINDISTDASTYWNTVNGSTGGSVIKYIPEAAWNDDAEIGAYCAANPTDTANCDPTGTGQIKITNQQTFQEDYWISSTGGGPSNCFTSSNTSCLGGFPQPSWQQSLSIPGQTTATRFVPDVSMLASPNFPGYIICTNGSCEGGIANGDFTVVGGTSASSPVFAGIVTLLNQDLGGSGLGNINPNLYQIATYYDPSVASGLKAFNTVNASDFPTTNPGSNTAYCQEGTPAGFPAAQVCPSTGTNAGIIGFLSSNADATTGYNMVTGLGSVDANNLATAFADISTATTTTITTTATSPVFVGQSVTFNVAVASPSKPNTASGAVTFTNGSGAAIFGTTANVSAGAGTLTTTQLPAGTDEVSATYNGIYKTSKSATPVTLTVVAPVFAVTPATGTLTVAPGSTAGPDTLTVTSTTNGFITGTPPVTAVAITYSCVGLPSESACVFSPASPTTSATVMVSITTTAPTSGQLRKPLDRGNHIFYAMLLPGLFGIVFTMGSRKTAGSRKRAARVVRLLSFIVVLGFSTTWLASCGGGSSGGGGNPGTPAGTYSITINSTAGTTQGTAGTISLTVS